MIHQAQGAAGARAQAGGHLLVRRHRSAQASLVHLPEDEEARQAVRRDLRSDGGPGDRQIGAGVLSRPGSHPSQLDPAAGADQGLHRVAPSPTRTSRCTPRSSGRAAISSRCRSAPRRCTGRRSTVSRRTGSTRPTPARGSDIEAHFGWFRQLLELQQDAHTPEEFLEFLKVDLFQDEIFVFTPKGDVKQLPKGATPIDFAFMVHTDVGLRCQGAKVNGRIAPLHRELKNGDTVEIFTGPGAQAEPRLAGPRDDGPRPAQDQGLDPPSGG